MRHEKVYPDTELKVGDEVYFKDKWREIQAFGDLGTYLENYGWVCKTKFKVEREAKLLDKYVINGKSYWSLPLVDKAIAETKESYERKLKEEQRINYHKAQQLLTQIAELKEVNSQLASAAISKEEVVFECTVGYNQFGFIPDCVGVGFEFKNGDKIKVVREV